LTPENTVSNENDSTQTQTQTPNAAPEAPVKPMRVTDGSTPYGASGALAAPPPEIGRAHV